MSEYIVDFGTSTYKSNDGLIFAPVEQLREEIVRCRDCKHYRFVDRSDIFHDERHNDSFCLRFVDGKRMEVEADGFCAWGEREDVSKWKDECLKCSECGCITDYVSYEDEPYMMTDEGATIPNYCPNCGAKVIGGDE